MKPPIGLGERIDAHGEEPERSWTIDNAQTEDRWTIMNHEGDVLASRPTDNADSGTMKRHDRMEHESLTQ